MDEHTYSFARTKDLELASPTRNLYLTKRENGKVVIIGGSEGFHGAPALASTAAYTVLAALRTGIGYAVEFVPKGILKEVRGVSPNIIVRSLTSNHLNLDDIAIIAKSLNSSESMVIGPGLGRNKETLKAAATLLDYARKSDKRVVVDADAIIALSKYGKKLSRNFIITPNSSEFALFCKRKIGEKDTNARVGAAMRISRELNANVLLKGHITVVTDGKRVKLIKSKYAALATMGTGDVLSGIIGAYAAKNDDMFIAAVAGAYLHALIGDRLYKEKGNHILASDVVDCIPQMLKKFDKNSK